MHAHFCQLSTIPPEMLVSVSIAAGFQLIFSWADIVVEECCMDFMMAVLK